MKFLLAAAGLGALAAAQLGGSGGKRNVGGAKDEGGCYTSAGYQYCKKLGKCFRSWELLKDDGDYGGMEWEDVCEKPQMLGDDEDEHGCKGTAGYSWCAAKNSCVRPLAVAESVEEFNSICSGTKPSCPGVMCMMHCEHGWKKNARGCDICSCAEAKDECKKTTCENSCSRGFMTDGNGCRTCKCMCPKLKCADQGCNGKFKLDKDGCQTCQCANAESTLDFCNDLMLNQRYCNTLAGCMKKCRCNMSTKMTVMNEGTRSAGAWCEAMAEESSEFCPDSPMQLCRMRCPERSCREGQCMMRKGTCCDMKCIDKKEDTPCEKGEEYDDLKKECVAVSCDANPCADGETCRPSRRACIRAPCQQFICEKATGGSGTRLDYDTYKKMCKKASPSEASDCAAMGCKFKKGKCKAQKASKFNCKLVSEARFCSDQGPSFCKWKSKKNKGKCVVRPKTVPQQFWAPLSQRALAANAPPSDPAAG